MNSIVKPIIEEMLQLRVDGKVRNVCDLLAVISRQWPFGELPFETMCEITDYAAEVLPCDNIPAAKALAAKYNLNICV